MGSIPISALFLFIIREIIEHKNQKAAQVVLAAKYLSFHLFKTHPYAKTKGIWV